MTQTSHGHLDRGVFEQTNRAITSFKATLPRDAVLSLAKEVVSRLAGRANELDRHAVAVPSSDEIDQLCTALTSTDGDAGARFISKIREDGAPLDVIYLSYLALAARRLGQWWDEDRIPSALVTIASSRIYAIMRGLGHVLGPPTKPMRNAAVFAAVPGEIHTIGVTMAADLFRRDGWEIELLVGRTHDDLLDHFRDSDATVFGLSASGSRSLVDLAKLLLAIRISCPQAQVMICGQIVLDEADLVAHLHADAMAHDVPSALAGMNTLMQRQAQAALPKARAESRCAS